MVIRKQKAQLSLKSHQQLAALLMLMENGLQHVGVVYPIVKPVRISHR